MAVAIDSESRYRTTLTSLASFHPPYQGQFRLVVTRNGQVLGRSWHAAVAKKGLRAIGEGMESFIYWLRSKSQGRCWRNLL